jgi:AsmA-like C-terminal region/AsmA family
LKKLFAKRRFALLCVLLMGLFVVRPPASRLRSRVLRSIAVALGRNVEVGSLHFRFLPRPGFEIEDLVIHDDPRFGAEPLLRAPEVTAGLQVEGLLHGRLEIATLTLSDASLNLTRNAAGAWNFENLLERTSRITVAPTASGRRRSRPQFPYIESSGTRVNFKSGAEKTHYALTDTKLALWQESENTWGIRLQARPIRTDSNLTDTGVINVSGSWQRSSVVHQTPLQFSFEWKQAQIGQISKLIYGIDQGWRGGGTISGHIAGTPEDLTIAADGIVDDFRRRDVIGGNDLRLAAHCLTEYSSLTRAISKLECAAPSGDGALELRGSAFRGQTSATLFPTYDLELSAKDVPSQSLLAFLRHTNMGLAGDLAANGHVSANFQLVRRDGGPPEVHGSGQFQELHLGSISSNADVPLGIVPFSVVYRAFGTRGVESVSGRYSAVSNTRISSKEPPQLEIGPFNVPLGRIAPIQVHALLSRSGYQASVHGDAAVKRLFESARVVGMAVPAVNAEGASSIDLKIAGSWSGDRPSILGTAQLHSVYAQVRGVNGPVSIARASLTLGDQSVTVLNLNASAANAVWHGWLRIPRACAAPPDCQFQFNLHTQELSASGLNHYFNPALEKKSWYKFLSIGDDHPRYLLQARAQGKISIDKLLLGNATCTNFSSILSLDQGRVTLSGLNGEVLGGTISGVWEANFNPKPPKYTGSGNFENVSLEEVADLMHDRWVAGTGTVKYDFSTAGWNLRDLVSSANLDADFSITDSSFPHVVLTSTSGPLRAETFVGSLRLDEGEVSIEDAKLETANSVYTVSGTASLSGELNLRIGTEGSPGFIISGTVLETRVSANPTTAASLKP